LTAVDRALLLVPTLVGLFFGVVLVVGVPFARWLGYLGNDAFFYWLAGAACLGYAVMGLLNLRSLA
jgi:hypothetical protein